MITEILNHVTLNLGIKKKFSRLTKKIKLDKTLDKLKKFDLYLSDRFNQKIQKKLDQFLFKYFYKKLDYYFAQRINGHYGADYHWNDQTSQNLDMDNHNLGFGQFLFSLTRNIRPKNILCIGSMYGFIPFMLASGCRDNKKGKVYFVDPGFDIGDDSHHNFGQGFWRKIKHPHKHFSYLGTRNYIKHFLLLSSEFHRQNPKLKFDLIYLDGDHTYKGAKEDFNNFWPQLNQNGYMIFHDINIIEEAPIHRGMKFEFWKIIKEIETRPDLQMITLPSHTSGISGLGIVQKIKSNEKNNKISA